MKVLIFEPNKHPRRADIPHTLEDMQKLVGGYIQVIYPFGSDPVGLVCDEESLFKDKPWNRYICRGVAIKGVFFLCGLGEEDLADLPDDMADKYEKELWDTQTVVHMPFGPIFVKESGKAIVIQ